jgi:hypothetical protein
MGKDWDGRQALFNNKINKKHGQYLSNTTVIHNYLRLDCVNTNIL